MNFKVLSNPGHSVTLTGGTSLVPAEWLVSQRACSGKNLADKQFSSAKRFSCSPISYTLHFYSTSCNCEQNSILLPSLVAAASL